MAAISSFLSCSAATYSPVQVITWCCSSHRAHQICRAAQHKCSSGSLPQSPGIRLLSKLPALLSGRLLTSFLWCSQEGLLQSERAHLYELQGCESLQRGMRN